MKEVGQEIKRTEDEEDGEKFWCLAIEGSEIEADGSQSVSWSAVNRGRRALISDKAAHGWRRSPHQLVPVGMEINRSS